ncbi:CYTH domain-containing protein [Nanoarchaeota archaeon]
MEIESKFIAPNERIYSGLEKRGFGVYKVLKIAQKHNLDTYFDTEDHHLYRSKITYRLRVVNKKKIKVTFKRKVSTKGSLYKREEFEETINENDLNDFHERTLKIQPVHEINQFIGDRLLHKALVVNNNRTVVILQTPSGHEIEMALDRIVYSGVHGKAKRSFEIELESINATEREIQDAATALNNAYPRLVPSPDSKYNRGLKLVGASMDHRS